MQLKKHSARRRPPEGRVLYVMDHPERLSEHPGCQAVVVLLVTAALTGSGGCVVYCYRESDSLLQMLGYLMIGVFVSLLLGTFALLVFGPALSLMEYYAGRLEDRGWPYWLAFVCLIPLGLLAAAGMVLYLSLGEILKGYWFW